MKRKQGKKKTKQIGERIHFEYREVLKPKIQGLIRIGCAVVAGCPT